MDKQAINRERSLRRYHTFKELPELHEKLKEKQKAYMMKRKDKINNYNREYYIKHRRTILQRMKEYNTVNNNKKRKEMKKHFIKSINMNSCEVTRYFNDMNEVLLKINKGL